MFCLLIKLISLRLAQLANVLLHCQSKNQFEKLNILVLVVQVLLFLVVKVTLWKKKKKTHSNFDPVEQQQNNKVVVGKPGDICTPVGYILQRKPASFSPHLA